MRVSIQPHLARLWEGSSGNGSGGDDGSLRGGGLQHVAAMALLAASSSVDSGPSASHHSIHPHMVEGTPTPQPLGYRQTIVTATPSMSAQVGSLWSASRRARTDLEADMRGALGTLPAELVLAPLKAFDRGIEKIEVDYEGDVSRLTDVVRCAVVVDSLVDFEAAAAAIKRHMHVVRFTDRMRKPLATGYRDHMYLVRLPVSDVVAEVQLLLRGVFTYKMTTAHKNYEATRKVMADAQRQGRPLSREERTLIEAVAEREAVDYDTIMKQYQDVGASGGSGGSGSGLCIVM